MRNKGKKSFKLRDFYSTYDGQQIVVEIPKLDLEESQLYFVLGSSGVGKSTLIETLGMMNNTIHQETKLINFNNEKSHNLKKLWSEDDRLISNFRKTNYSFIFQNTNLMPHFSAGENMCFTLLMQGMSMEDAKKKVLPIMDSLGLNRDLFDRKVQHLSGGQRQRLAFVRALVADFKVLFGDEPTGNLDRHTSSKLMTSLKKHLITYKKTGIIVSHDINLAIEFADKIFFFELKEEPARKPYGYLDNDQCIYPEDGQWKKGNGDHIDNPELFLSELLSN